jgi:hypothetical protein
LSFVMRITAVRALAGRGARLEQGATGAEDWGVGLPRGELRYCLCGRMPGIATGRPGQHGMHLGRAGPAQEQHTAQPGVLLLRALVNKAVKPQSRPH